MVEVRPQIDHRHLEPRALGVLQAHGQVGAVALGGDHVDGLGQHRHPVVGEEELSDEPTGDLVGLLVGEGGLVGDVHRAAGWVEGVGGPRLDPEPVGEGAPGRRHRDGPPDRRGRRPTRPGHHHDEPRSSPPPPRGYAHPSVASSAPRHPLRSFGRNRTISWIGADAARNVVAFAAVSTVLSEDRFVRLTTGHDQMFACSGGPALGAASDAAAPSGVAGAQSAHRG